MSLDTALPPGGMLDTEPHGAAEDWGIAANDREVVLRRCQPAPLEVTGNTARADGGEGVPQRCPVEMTS